MQASLRTRQSKETSEIVNDEGPSRFEQLWTIEQAAACLMLSKRTLYGWRCRKVGPPSYRIGNQIRYRPGEVRTWVDANALTPAG